MRIAKADLVPTAANLLGEYRTFGQLETACREFGDEVNGRVHRETRHPPVEMLAEKPARLHRMPERAFTVAFGATRRANWDATISVEGVRYWVPHQPGTQRRFGPAGAARPPPAPGPDLNTRRPRPERSPRCERRPPTVNRTQPHHTAPESPERHNNRGARP